MDLSVCVVTWNVKDDVANCLQSLQDPQGDIDHETIVVDNASADGTVEMIGNRFPNVRLICNDRNVGFASANVQAMEAAGGRYMLLLNPDTIVPRGALGALVEFADDHPQAGVVGPKLVYGDGTLQYSCRRFPTITAALYRNTVIGRLIPTAPASSDYLMKDFDHDRGRRVDWVSGACMLIRREAAEEIGPLDTEFFWGGEDVDYCWRMHEAGREVLYTPEPAITHLVGRSTDQAPLATIVRHHRGLFRLYSKHVARGSIGKILVWGGVWLRALLMLGQYIARRTYRKGRQLLRKLAGLGRKENQ